MSGYTYIGREPCGCITFARIDDGDASTAEHVADCIRSGRPVERVANTNLRDHWFGHRSGCPKKPMQAVQMTLL